MRNPFRYFNSSPEVIRLTVMMYIRYPLSLRQVEDLQPERGIDLCHETVRLWWNRFGPMFAAEIRKRRVQGRSYSIWRWHLDEVFSGSMARHIICGVRLITKAKCLRSLPQSAGIARPPLIF
jgi:transposase-like protein